MSETLEQVQAERDRLREIVEWFPLAQKFEKLPEDTVLSVGYWPEPWRFAPVLRIGPEEWAKIRAALAGAEEATR